MGKTKKTFLSKARSWAVAHKLFGPQAFLKYVMFSFLEGLNQVSDEFILKGGNLLWFYIQTPRATIDLDLATRTLETDEKVRKMLERACDRVEGIQFKVKSLEPISDKQKRGAMVTVSYKTEQGASNSFTMDIVYKVPTDFKEIDSPITESQSLKAATFENIIVDKIAALARFGSGNTRIKDFDDLWRVAQKNPKIDTPLLKKMLKTRGVAPDLKTEWINDPMSKAWSSHVKRYKDLPESLEKLFRDVNHWLQEILGNK